MPSSSDRTADPDDLASAAAAAFVGPADQQTRVREQVRFAAALAARASDRPGWTDRCHRAVEAVRDGPADDPDAVVETVEEVLEPIGERAREYRLHFVGHTHIDMNWLWDHTETARTTHRTFATMLELMEEYPEFRFSGSQAATYALMAEHAPDLLDRIGARVEAGQWEVTANAWVEADRNMSSGEAQARHVLYTDAFLDEVGFDVDVPIAFEPDTFGHPATTPKLLAAADVEYYYFCRAGGRAPPGRDDRSYDGSYADLPRLFRWESPDGSRVLAWNDGDGWYHGHVDPADALAALAFEAETGLTEYPILYGVGDHGGGPTRADVETVLAMDEWPVFPETTFGRLDAFFDGLPAEALDSLPVVDEELNFVFRGCYAAQSRTKAANRRLEHLLGAAEAVGTVASVEADDFAYPADSLTSAWRATLFNQFHDVLPGAGVPETYDHAQGEYQRAETAATLARDRALEAIAPGEFYREDAETYREGVPVAVFNPTERPRSGTVEVVLFEPPEWDLEELVARDGDGRTAPVQVVETKSSVAETYSIADLPDRSRLLHDAMFDHEFVVVAFPVDDVPATGYEVVRVEESDGDGGTPVSVGRDGGRLWMENERLRVSVEPRSAGVVSLYDRARDAEVVPDGERMGVVTVEHEAPHDMSAWIRGQTTTEEPLRDGWRTAFDEVGPVRATIRATRSYGDSTLALELSLAAGGASVEWTLQADWREFGDAERGVPVLRTSFPAAVDDPVYRYDVPFGAVERPADGRDVPAQGWADVSDRTSGAGITVANDTTYGHCGDGDELSLTLLRSSYAPDPLPEAGERTVSYAVWPHGPDWDDARARWHATTFGRPLVVRQLHSRSDVPLDEQRFFAVDEEAVAVTGLKRAENGEDVVVRLVETRGEPATAGLEFAWPVDDVVETDLREEPIATDDSAVRLRDEHAVDVSLAPSELKTLRLRLG